MNQIMKAVMINSNSCDFKQTMPLGLITIATLLKDRHGIQTTIFDLPVENNTPPDIDAFVEQLNIDGNTLFVGFSTLCSTFPRSLSIARSVKQKHPSIVIEFGGPQASATAYDLIEKYPFIDVVMVGEAEGVLDDFVSCLVSKNPTSKPGLIFREVEDLQDKSIIRIKYPPMAPLVEINSLPQLDYSIYPQANSNNSVAIDVGRGCPYNCSFCSSDFSRR